MSRVTPGNEWAKEIETELFKEVARERTRRFQLGTERCHLGTEGFQLGTEGFQLGTEGLQLGTELEKG